MGQVTEVIKARRITLTKVQKAEICQLWKVGLPKLKFNIGESTQDRSANCPQLEEILNLWVSKAEAQLRYNYPTFHIKEYTKQGEATSSPTNDIPHYCDELKDIIKKYHPWDAYNCDETGLYWRLEPEKHLQVTGDDKLPPLLIYKYQNPHAIRHIDKAKLPKDLFHLILKFIIFLLIQQPCDAGIIALEFNIKDAIGLSVEAWKWPEDFDLTLPRPQLETTDPDPTNLVAEFNDDEEPEVRVSHKEVITSINNILHFINQENGFNVDGFFIQKLGGF
ncbi:756_t:CDS:2 [Dentiscutata erythropus]|uniref:756_t:CDS:1 n=1 Tax=Dentiscutata erythropus TaxID=1348616 RepID=A0A9N9I6Q5_9GLOM|nr:756_t:CDS:2 [Dentiscutata erythropus]